MTHSLGDSAPDALAKARNAGTTADIPLHTFADADAAYAFQADAVEAISGSPCGYKVGATSEAAQTMLNCPGPFHAPVLEQHVLESGASFTLPDGLPGVECEFGFVLARDYPEGGAADMDTLRDAVSGCFIALEIVGRRVVDEVPLNEMSAIADYGLTIAVVRGPEITDWGSRDLAGVAVSALVDGEIVGEGTGANVLGDPWNSLLWAAGALKSRGQGLRAGDIVMTGTCTGIAKVASGQAFEGRFAGLGSVEVSFA